MKKPYWMVVIFLQAVSTFDNALIAVNIDIWPKIVEKKNLYVRNVQVIIRRMSANQWKCVVEL